ncbi:unnamed protein product [Amoebophrya sp. A120]|nr:unnamed protein product [Amoebophrya sp. A120]|eukprot:GSA120T00009564001.1
MQLSVANNYADHASVYVAALAARTTSESELLILVITNSISGAASRRTANRHHQRTFESPARKDLLTLILHDDSVTVYRRLIFGGVFIAKKNFGADARHSGRLSRREVVAYYF